jgi:hypothetical protein
MPSKDCKCPVDLFAEHNPGQFMRQGHRSEGEKHSRLRPFPVGPAIRWPDSENHARLSLVALPP